MSGSSQTKTYRIEVTFPDRVAYFDNINNWNIADDLLILSKGNVTTVIPMRNIGRLVSEAI